MITSFNLGGGGDTYTKQEIDTKVEGLESEISNKVDIETLSDYYTKEETYNKEEVDALIPEGGAGTVYYHHRGGDRFAVETVNEMWQKYLDGYNVIIYENGYNTDDKLVSSITYLYTLTSVDNDYWDGKTFLSSLTFSRAENLFLMGNEPKIHYMHVSKDGLVFQDEKILAEKSKVYSKEETYNKEEVDALISPKTPNVVKFGELEIEDGVMSNFSSTNYAQFPFLMDLTDKAFEINMEITTSGNVTSQQNILDSQDGLAFAVRNSKFVLAVSNNGSSWAFEAEGGVVESNTTYLIKLSWNRLVYKVLYSTDNGSNWNEAISQAYGGHPYPRTMIIGKDTTNSYIYSGVINLNKCTLSVNNQYVWDGMTDAGLLTRLATDLSNIDNNGVEYINSLIDNKLNPIATRLQNILGDN